MLQALVSTASQLLQDLNRAFLRPRGQVSLPRSTSSSSPTRYQPLQRVLLTDGVGRTLFEEYAAHRLEARGDEETGWVLLGLREPTQAVVLATLPAGTARDASVGHVRFNSMGQALGSRIVRQSDRRLTILGVVHTHPGSLRHPSDGDYAGDSQWVYHLRGGEGVFGIGTSDGDVSHANVFVYQPRPHVQCLGEFCLSWYGLGQGGANYRPLPVEVTIGPDLARPLHAVWSIIEAHAERLDRIYRQLTGVTFELAAGECGRGLVVRIPLSEPGTALRILVKEKEVRYYVIRGNQVLATDSTEDRVDRGVYLLLAELAAHDG